MKAIVKIVTVLAVYKFKNVARICFTVLSSNGSDTYHVCFHGNGRESCDCPSTSKKGCYHLNGLRERAQAYFESLSKIVEEEQADGSIIVWSVSPDGSRKEVARYRKVSNEQQAPTHEGEGKLPTETRQALYNFKQSISGDAMEREYEENRRSYQRMMENGY